MSSVTYETCDRCKKKLSGRIVRLNRVKATYLFGGGPYNYVDVNFDLCEDCGKDLEKFMQGIKI